ncbi:MAG: molybdopterin oxidoreductase [Puniceicoccaceae bacterium]|nr:MAG: molybdopterin oxidoreductase [Puniceicoccaceae bacterium]
MLLKEQGTLQTPVGAFSAQHAAGLVEPEQAKFYKQLIPLSKPGAGEQYAFKVDLDKCTGCKACVSACHSLNGLEENETWRDVGTIHGVDLAGAAYTQTVTTACHHCTDPACLNGCPVLAYEKDPHTGIVYHLDDQCIGCQYCVLKCPYDVPKYSKQLGIVRKCDLCQSRLADGEAPACAQACPTEAISITIVNTQDAEQQARQVGDFLPGAPEPAYTVPTTQYVSKRSIPVDAVAADHCALRPEHGHLPLVFMLVLTQLSVGLFTFAFWSGEAVARATITAGFIAMSVGLGASICHLGRPLGAWRAFLGLRRSWLSREIVAFGIFSAAAGAYLLSAYVEGLPAGLQRASGGGTVALGLIGVFTSVMIYHDTQRPFWYFPITAVKFYGTTLGLAAAAYLLIATALGAASPGAFIVLFLSVGAKWILDALLLRSAWEREMSPAKKSARLMLHPLRWSTLARMLTAPAGLGAACALWIVPDSLPLAALCFLLILSADLLERTLFFRAVAAPKMPGGVD